MNTLAGASMKATRRGVKKSRGGCTRCKSQHLKCDEKKPNCGRCERLGVSCPGFSKLLKWSTKHEVSPLGKSSLDTAASPAPSAAVTSEEPVSPFPGLSDLDWMEMPLSPMFSDVTLANKPRGIWDASLEDNNELTWLDSDVLSIPQDLAVEENSLQLSRMNNQPLLRSLQRARPRVVSQIPSSLSHQASELLSFYFKIVPRVYSMFDGRTNPFRSAVSNLFSHSLAVNLAAQSMAASFLHDVHPRFAALGQKLRNEAIEVVKSQPNDSYDAMLALMMSGPTGNWHRAEDLGMASYHMMRDRLDAFAASADHNIYDNNYLFFQEAMVHWEMLLSYVVDADTLRPQGLLPTVPNHPFKQVAHPWTGVGRETHQVVAEIGRLVRAHRISSLKQKFVTQAYVGQMSRDISRARHLEKQLLASHHPDEGSIVSLDDTATPVWHLTTIAECYRYAGLLQLYRVFPDLLSERLASAETAEHIWLAEVTDTPPALASERADEWTRAFAIEALRLLETIPLESGTKDFQPFLLVAISSELVCEQGCGDEGSPDDITYDTNPMDAAFTDMALKRKIILDRLTACLQLLPPTPIRVCLEIVKESWRRIDSGTKGVYWLDVMVENKWETLLA